jgi:hypothetical protein
LLRQPERNHGLHATHQGLQYAPHLDEERVSLMETVAVKLVL